MTATFQAIRVIKRFQCYLDIFSISDFNLANNLLVSVYNTDLTHRLINYFVSLIIVAITIPSEICHRDPFLESFVNCLLTFTCDNYLSFYSYHYSISLLIQLCQIM